MISHKKKFIFIHVPKTAGMTLINALEPHRDEEYYNEDMICAVQKKYSKDIELFKYEFNE